MSEQEFRKGQRVYKPEHGYGIVIEDNQEGTMYPVRVHFDDGEYSDFTKGGSYYGSAETEKKHLNMDLQHYDTPIREDTGEEPKETPVGEDPTNPDYYRSGGIECIEAIKASMTLEEFRGFLKGNVQKYVWRFEHKNGLEDLKKAAWYLNRLIAETLDGGVK